MVDIRQPCFFWASQKLKYLRKVGLLASLARHTPLTWSYRGPHLIALCTSVKNPGSVSRSTSAPWYRPAPLVHFWLLHGQMNGIRGTSNWRWVFIIDGILEQSPSPLRLSPSCKAFSRRQKCRPRRRGVRCCKPGGNNVFEPASKPL